MTDSLINRRGLRSESNWLLPIRLRTQIALVRKVPMLGTKSGLRKIAAITALTLGLSTFTNTSALAADAYANSVTLLSKAFGSDKTKIVLFDSVQPGITLEAMLQLKAGGRSFIKQLPAIQYNLTNAQAPIGLTSKGAYSYKGYLFNADSKKSIKPGLAGKWLFTSEVIDAANGPHRYAVLKKLQTQVSASSGGLTVFDSASGSYVANTSVFDYAWVSMGLNSYQEYSLANKVLQKMLTLQNADGSFGQDANSYADATGLALQAINYMQNFGTSAEDKKRADAEKRAVKFLKSAAINPADASLPGDRWLSFGEESVNASAYALMGLKAAAVSAKTTAPHLAWLKSNLLASGGFKTSFSNGAADIFATSQALAASLGKSYLELLPN